MLLDTIVQIAWSPNNRTYYEERGYKFTKMRDKFTVKQRDLMQGSDAEVLCECDNCGKPFKICFFMRFI